MKARYIMILSLLAAALSSCKVNDIAYYSEDARIEFSGASGYTFTDEDWLNTYVLGNAAYVDGEFTVKRVRLEKGCAWLMPSNPKYQPIRVDADNEFLVWGVVRHVIKTFK